MLMFLWLVVIGSGRHVAGCKKNIVCEESNSMGREPDEWLNSLVKIGAKPWQNRYYGNPRT